MFEDLGFEMLTAPQVAVFFGLGLGVLFGLLAQITRFCLRRAIIASEDRTQAAGLWLTAFAVAVMGTQTAVASGWIDFADHRFMANELPVLAIVLGGLLFGTGMVLTRGCISRLSVLTGTGNIRALTVLIIFALTAHAALKGVLAPVRASLGSLTVQFDGVMLPGQPMVWAAALGLGALAIGLRSGNRPAMLGFAAMIGALVPIGWVGTGFVLYDDFDPIVMESLSFTSPTSEALFFTVASTAISPGFGTGLIGGVIVGAMAAALLSGQFQWQSFETPRQTGRYFTGAVLMGLGGVLAGGCTVGAGLSGVPTLSLAAILALASIVIGGMITDRTLRASATRQASAIPAE